MTFSISTKPAGELGAEGCSKLSDADFIEVGRQGGFDAATLGKLWNSLGSFLHVSMPRSKGDPLNTFGDSDKVRRHVGKARDFLSSLSEATLICGGLGGAVSFTCNCGTTNKRRAHLLTNGQTVSCMDRACSETWTVEIAGDDIGFRRCTIALKCKSCSAAERVPRRMLLELEREQMLTFDCSVCRTKNLVVWKLMHAVQSSSPDEAANPQIASV